MKVNLCGWINGNTAGSSAVVELGAGFFNQLNCVHSSVNKKIGIEIWDSYISSARCQDCIKIKGDLTDFESLIPKEDMDCAMIIDVLEHFPRSEALTLVKKIKNNFNKFLLMVPEGNHPQEKDTTGHGAHEYQKHRSTWTKLDLEAIGFNEIHLDKDFHEQYDESKDDGCLFATWKKN